MSSQPKHRNVKEEIRLRVWRTLEEKGIAKFPRPVYGRIPNFIGAEEAAEKLFRLKEWVNAEVVKVNPDSPQYLVRLQALRERKKLLMPSPRLKSGFLILDPKEIPESSFRRAVTIRGVFTYGKRVRLEQLKHIGNVDFIVEGSVAVTLKGERLGKGEGYGELEYAILRELGLVNDDTPVATTVHEVQIVDYIPRDPWDVPVDIIATPRRLVRVNVEGLKPKGIIWKVLKPEKIEEIPLLREMLKKRNSQITSS